MEAYGFNIMPVRDKTTWAKMNGVKVNPPVYEKKVESLVDVEESSLKSLKEEQKYSNMVCNYTVAIAKELITIRRDARRGRKI